MPSAKNKKQPLPVDPLQRLIIIIDGSDEFGVVGMRARIHRLTTLVYVLLAMQIVSALAKGGDISILASLLANFLKGGL